jgi:alpha,alpha-trehalase
MSIQLFYPEQAYKQLYEDVMTLRIFGDSKTFADAIPLISVNEINTLYQKINRSDKQQILEFVNHWFRLPNGNETIPNIESVPIHQHITSLWNLLIREPDKPEHTSSLIPLPYSYVVPGGRFREIYYWDSYFTMLGLRVSGKHTLIRDMINNFAWQLQLFDHIPNGNRSYFLSRSQPPFFSLMISLLADIEGPEVYIEFLPHLLREYSFWMDGSTTNQQDFRRIVKVGENQLLNRYFDDSDTPRAESWAEDVLLAKSLLADRKEFYRNLKAACESGWDFSSRWLAEENNLNTIQTTDIIPVDLNSLLFILEKTIAHAYSQLGEQNNADEFELKSNKRAELINKLLWNDDEGIYCDLNIHTNTYGIPSLAMMYPLFAGISTPLQAERSIKYLTDHFLRPGGWVTSNKHTGQQWDAPNGWAPLQWITYIGLKNNGKIDLAKDGALQWLSLNEKVFTHTGRMMEKYNVEDLSLEAGGGEYPVQDGFGWTNGVYLALSKEIEK